MTKRMLIDASHPEETRLVVMDGNKVEDFDVEAADRLPLKGNIYLAKIVRVEPSLQAAFVEYGGNRHGFLAFSEIHPDYYQIPVADRQRLLEMQAQEAEYEDDDEAELDTAAERVAPSDDRDLGSNGNGGRENSGRDRRGGRGRGRDRNRGRAAASGENGGEETPNTTGRDPFGDETPPPEGQEPDSAGRDAFHDDEQPQPSQTPDTAGRDAFEGGAAGGVEPGEGATPANEHGTDASRSDSEVERDRTEHRASGRSPFADEDASPAGQRPDAAQDATGPLSTEPPPDATEPAATATESGEAAFGESPDSTAPAPAPAAHSGADQAPHQVFGDAPQDPGATEPTSRAQPMSMHAEQVTEGSPVIGTEEEGEETPPPETIGGNEGEERSGTPRIPPRFLRHYKIQEVIRRRQIILVQVVKEERGNKGAALTSYISLAGRFSVLMPNSPRGGGVSRKITQVADRKRLREAVEEMELPRGMSIIVRTAGAQRPKTEIKRDGEYLLRLWDEIRERTLASTAPALVYEEADLIKRALRDSFGREVDEVEVEGEDAWRQARDFMRLIMPQHEKKIRLYRDPSTPLFARAGAEAQLDGMMNPTVQLPSGGYIVINQTEALVAIDVNSGRATRDRHIEDTALRTNCEAAEEIGRQLRLRDLAGLIVIDFIDMESSRNDAQVEKRLKDALRLDRARIQVGRISHFGLLEMSRQRLRPSVTEHSFTTCPHCQGRGIVRSVESAALHVLRAIEEEGSKRRASEIVVHASEPVALHLLNRKRERLASIEARYAMCVLVSPDAELSEAQVRVERTRAQQMLPPSLPPKAPALRMDYAPEATPMPVVDDSEMLKGEASLEAEAQQESETPGATSAEVARRRRRRRRGGRREDGQVEANAGARDEEGVESDAEAPEVLTEGAEPPLSTPEEAGSTDGNAATDEQRFRRRGRRGGRRRAEELAARGGAGQPRPEEQPYAADAPRYVGPTPADPFAGTYDGVFEAMAAAEAAALNMAAPEAAIEDAVAISSPEALEDVPAEVLETAGPASTEPDPSTDFLPAAETSVVPAPEAPPPVAERPADALPPVAEPAPAAGVISAADENGVSTASRPEPVVGAPVQPVVLGDSPAGSTPRRQGWWNR